ncbi:hypothetical protein LU679_30570 [Pseudomonas putida]|nr:hypothetical protein [Pseudomonas putida]MCE0883451.1 hypothetical protein [Pseudomonas putida]MDD1990124.1 hypothetical protein [Pseudomonas putida]
MDARTQVDIARTKAFYDLLVEKLGKDVWATRKAAYLRRIRERESQFDIRLPVEPQLFSPADDDIDWYLGSYHSSSNQCLGHRVVGFQPEGTAGIELHVCDLDIPEDTFFTPIQLGGSLDANTNGKKAPTGLNNHPGSE